MKRPSRLARLFLYYHRLTYWLSRLDEEQLGMIGFGMLLFFLGCNVYWRAVAR